MTDLVFTPKEVGDLGLEHLERRQAQSGDGMPLYIASLDYEPLNDTGFLPLLRGELATIIARPGNGKTSFMLRWARKRAKVIAEDARNKGEDAKKAVVYVTREQHVEDLQAYIIAAEEGISISTMAFGTFSNDQMDKIQSASARRANLPLWLIGHSAKRRKKRPNLTIDSLAQSLNEIEKWNGEDCAFQIDSIFVDYLQRFPIPQGAESQTIGFSQIVDRLKDAALAFDTRVVLGVQAKREVDERALPIPQMEDGQWTSNIEQSSDAVISLVRPRHYKHDAESFGDMIVQGHDQMLVSILKRKLGPENFARWVLFDPRYNKLNEAEVKAYDFRKQKGKDE